MCIFPQLKLKKMAFSVPMEQWRHREVEIVGLFTKLVDYWAGDLKPRESGSADHPLAPPTVFNLPDVVFHSFTNCSWDSTVIYFTDKFI